MRQQDGVGSLACAKGSSGRTPLRDIITSDSKVQSTNSTSDEVVSCSTGVWSSDSSISTSQQSPIVEAYVAPSFYDTSTSRSHTLQSSYIPASHQPSLTRSSNVSVMAADIYDDFITPRRASHYRHLQPRVTPLACSHGSTGGHSSNQTVSTIDSEVLPCTDVLGKPTPDVRVITHTHVQRGQRTRSRISYMVRRSVSDMATQSMGVSQREPISPPIFSPPSARDPAPPAMVRRAVPRVAIPTTYAPLNVRSPCATDSNGSHLSLVPSNAHTHMQMTALQLLEPPSQPYPPRLAALSPRKVSPKDSQGVLSQVPLRPASPSSAPTTTSREGATALDAVTDHISLASRLCAEATSSASLDAPSDAQVLLETRPKSNRRRRVLAPIADNLRRSSRLQEAAEAAKRAAVQKRSRSRAASTRGSRKGELVPDMIVIRNEEHDPDNNCILLYCPVPSARPTELHDEGKSTPAVQEPPRRFSWKSIKRRARLCVRGWDPVVGVVPVSAQARFVTELPVVRAAAIVPQPATATAEAPAAILPSEVVVATATPPSPLTDALGAVGSPVALPALQPHAPRIPRSPRRRPHSPILLADSDVDEDDAPLSLYGEVEPAVQLKNDAALHLSITRSDSFTESSLTPTQPPICPPALLQDVRTDAESADHSPCVGVSSGRGDDGSGSAAERDSDSDESMSWLYSQEPYEPADHANSPCTRHWLASDSSGVAVEDHSDSFATSPRFRVNAWDDSRISQHADESICHSEEADAGSSVCLCEDVTVISAAAYSASVSTDDSLRSSVLFSQMPPDGTLRDATDTSDLSCSGSQLSSLDVGLFHEWNAQGSLHGVLDASGENADTATTNATTNAVEDQADAPTLTECARSHSYDLHHDPLVGNNETTAADTRSFSSEVATTSRNETTAPLPPPDTGAFSSTPRVNFSVFSSPSQSTPVLSPQDTCAGTSSCHMSEHTSGRLAFAPHDMFADPTETSSDESGFGDYDSLDRLPLIASMPLSVGSQDMADDDSPPPVPKARSRTPFKRRGGTHHCVTEPVPALSACAIETVGAVSPGSALNHCPHAKQTRCTSTDAASAAGTHSLETALQIVASPPPPRTTADDTALYNPRRNTPPVSTPLPPAAPQPTPLCLDVSQTSALTVSSISSAEVTVVTAPAPTIAPSALACNLTQTQQSDSSADVVITHTSLLLRTSSASRRAASPVLARRGGWQQSSFALPPVPMFTSIEDGVIPGATSSGSPVPGVSDPVEAQVPPLGTGALRSLSTVRTVAWRPVLPISQAPYARTADCATPMRPSHAAELGECVDVSVGGLASPIQQQASTAAAPQSSLHSMTTPAQISLAFPAASPTATPPIASLTRSSAVTQLPDTLHSSQDLSWGTHCSGCANGTPGGFSADGTQLFLGSEAFPRASPTSTLQRSIGGARSPFSLCAGAGLTPGKRLRRMAQTQSRFTTPLHPPFYGNTQSGLHTPASVLVSPSGRVARARAWMVPGSHGPPTGQDTHTSAAQAHVAELRGAVLPDTSAAGNPQAALVPSERSVTPHQSFHAVPDGQPLSFPLEHGAMQSPLQAQLNLPCSQPPLPATAVCGAQGEVKCEPVHPFSQVSTQRGRAASDTAPLPDAASIRAPVPPASPSEVHCLSTVSPPATGGLTLSQLSAKEAPPVPAVAPTLPHIEGRGRSGRRPLARERGEPRPPPSIEAQEAVAREADVDLSLTIDSQGYASPCHLPTTRATGRFVATCTHTNTSSAELSASYVEDHTPLQAQITQHSPTSMALFSKGVRSAFAPLPPRGAEWHSERTHPVPGAVAHADDDDAVVRRVLHFSQEALSTRDASVDTSVYEDDTGYRATTDSDVAIAAVAGSVGPVESECSNRSLSCAASSVSPCDAYDTGHTPASQATCGSNMQSVTSAATDMLLARECAVFGLAHEEEEMAKYGLSRSLRKVQFVTAPTAGVQAEGATPSAPVASHPQSMSLESHPATATFLQGVIPPSPPTAHCLKPDPPASMDIESSAPAVSVALEDTGEANLSGDDGDRDYDWIVEDTAETLDSDYWSGTLWSSDSSLISPAVGHGSASSSRASSQQPRVRQEIVATLADLGLQLSMGTWDSSLPVRDPRTRAEVRQLEQSTAGPTAVTRLQRAFPSTDEPQPDERPRPCATTAHTASIAEPTAPPARDCQALWRAALSLPVPLRVATFNTKNYFCDKVNDTSSTRLLRGRYLSDVLAQLALDVVVLQEVRSLQDIRWLLTTFFSHSPWKHVVFVPSQSKARPQVITPSEYNIALGLHPGDGQESKTVASSMCVLSRLTIPFLKKHFGVRGFKRVSSLQPTNVFSRGCLEFDVDASAPLLDMFTALAAACGPSCSHLPAPFACVCDACVLTASGVPFFPSTDDPAFPLPPRSPDARHHMSAVRVSRTPTPLPASLVAEVTGCLVRGQPMLPSGHTATLYTSHFVSSALGNGRTTEVQRERQARAVTCLIQQRWRAIQYNANIIVLGDLNDGHSSATASRLERRHTAELTRRDSSLLRSLSIAPLLTHEDVHLVDLATRSDGPTWTQAAMVGERRVYSTLDYVFISRRMDDEVPLSPIAREVVAYAYMNSSDPPVSLGNSRAATVSFKDTLQVQLRPPMNVQARFRIARKAWGRYRYFCALRHILASAMSHTYAAQYALTAIGASSASSSSSSSSSSCASRALVAGAPQISYSQLMDAEDPGWTDTLDTQEACEAAVGSRNIFSDPPGAELSDHALVFADLVLLPLGAPHPLLPPILPWCLADAVDPSSPSAEPPNPFQIPTPQRGVSLPPVLAPLPEVRPASTAQSTEFPLMIDEVVANAPDLRVTPLTSSVRGSTMPARSRKQPLTSKVFTPPHTPGAGDAEQSSVVTHTTPTSRRKRGTVSLLACVDGSSQSTQSPLPPPKRRKQRDVSASPRSGSDDAAICLAHPPATPTSRGYPAYIPVSTAARGAVRDTGASMDDALVVSVNGDVTQTSPTHLSALHDNSASKARSPPPPAPIDISVNNQRSPSRGCGPSRVSLRSPSAGAGTRIAAGLPMCTSSFIYCPFVACAFTSVSIHDMRAHVKAVHCQFSCLQLLGYHGEDADEWTAELHASGAELCWRVYKHLPSLSKHRSEMVEQETGVTHDCDCGGSYKTNRTLLMHQAYNCPNRMIRSKK